jgi:hypothetical protein
MFIRACASAVMLAILAAALGCMMAAVGPASADPQALQLSGRWIRYVSDPKHVCRDASCRLTYDLVRCGDGWCGVEVKDDKQCGRVALRLDAGASTQFGVEFAGRYEKAEGTQPYAVKASLRQPPNERALLTLLGNTDGDFQPLRRTYPLHMVLVREGDAVCAAPPKVS